MKELKFWVHSFILKLLWQILTVQWEPWSALPFPAPATETCQIDVHLCFSLICTGPYTCIGTYSCRYVQEEKDTLFLPSTIRFSSSIQPLSTASAGLAMYSPFTLTELRHKQGLLWLINSSSSSWNKGIVLFIEPVGAVLSFSAGSHSLHLARNWFKIISLRVAGVKNLGIKQMPLKTMHFLLKSSYHNNCTVLLLSNKALFLCIRKLALQERSWFTFPEETHHMTCKMSGSEEYKLEL